MAKHDVEFDYFHGYESEQFAFYRIPKVLFTDDYLWHPTLKVTFLFFRFFILHPCMIPTDFLMLFQDETHSYGFSCRKTPA